MRIAFMGTPDFSVPCLRALAASKHEVVGVFCQPDKPVGRKQILTPPPVKEEALIHGYRVFQPTTLKNGAGVALLREIEPDLVIVVAYGKILPPDFLSFPKYGCVNVHASLLPRYRGASPIHWAVLNGDMETGVTTMQLDEGMDTGDILLVKKVPIGPDETTEELFDVLSAVGAEAMMETIGQIEAGTLHPVAQDHDRATAVGLLTKELGEVDWTKPMQTVHNQVRGLYSWPGAYTFLDGSVLKLHRTARTAVGTSKAPGTVVKARGQLLVACGDGLCLELKEVQLSGKKRMDAAAFLNGNQIAEGDVLGS